MRVRTERAQIAADEVVIVLKRGQIALRLGLTYLREGHPDDGGGDDEGAYDRAGNADDEVPQQARRELLFCFVRQDQLATCTGAGVHHELARWCCARTFAAGPVLLAARRTAGIEDIARCEQLLVEAHCLVKTEEAFAAETAHVQELLESRWRVVELAGIPNRLLIENNVGAIRNNAGHFARVVVDEEGAA